MSIKQSDYETVLADYSNRKRVISLLGMYREYMEMIPSMRRPTESVITIPLPLAKVRNLKTVSGDSLTTMSKANCAVATDEVISIPCDIAVLMCDPEWKIKIGVEILVFIHRPQEDFSDLLRRWRQTQIYLHKEYEWIMPKTEEHIFSDLAEGIRPLFVLFSHTPDRIKKGLFAANLPYVEYVFEIPSDDSEFLPSQLKNNF